MLDLWEWLQDHHRFFPVRERESHDHDLICVQPEKLKNRLVLELHPVDFCPVPLISMVDIVKLESTSCTLRWEVQNATLVGGFVIDYQLTADRNSAMTSINIAPFERQIDMVQLNPETLYTVCIQANGKYLQNEGSTQPTYVVDHQQKFGELVTSTYGNRKCLQVSFC